MVRNSGVITTVPVGDFAAPRALIWATTSGVLATTLIVIVLLTFGLLHVLVRKNENLAKTVSN